MTTDNGCGGCSKDMYFSLTEKITAGILFNGGVLVGTWGIWLSSPLMALAYVVYALGSFTLLMRYTICTRCPHLLEAGDCLFVPAKLGRRIIVGPRTGPLSLWQRGIFYAAFVGTFLLPVWSLLPHGALLVTYALLVVGLMAAFRFHFCSKRCLVAVCPLNKNPQAR